MPENKMMSLDKSKAGRIVFFRILIIILADVVVSTLFDFVKAEGNREFSFVMNVLPALRIAFAALLVLSALYWVLASVKKLDTSAHIMPPEMITALSLYLTVTAVFYDRFRISPILFYTMTIIASVLFAVYYIYTILLYRK